MSPSQAAWLPAPGEQLIVKDIPNHKPGPGEAVIKNAAVAIVPLPSPKHAQQLSNPNYRTPPTGKCSMPLSLYISNSSPNSERDLGILIPEYPWVLGLDAAGTVEEVGEGVTRLRKGQRVISHSLPLKTANIKNSAFQLYPVISETVTSPIPDSMSFTQAVVLPSVLSTASMGLYHKGYLNLPFPSTSPKPTGTTILIWGGASSVGATATQLAVASGVKVITTASSKNHEFVKSLGAAGVVDYKSENVVEELVDLLSGEKVVGVFDAVSEDVSLRMIERVLGRLGLEGVRVATVLVPNGVYAFESRRVFAYTIAEEENKAIADAIWRDFVPEALESGRLKALPEASVVGNGLESIQHGLDVQKRGVSARKVVVSI
ncbi:Alcohol dehydrogenase GroES-like domain protein [Aspergillus sclerotialis]|uniref:Alcohol dehydrogenase GroES-like domain protein n=1 Tax=Aspergillus sclerotialis TaxID=2070753 RepID=A0A3A2ZAP1_9EURO|nr:Alcohol dehydrogenase GroES-like domain protein [Aspergillus sclerotialis]